MVNPELPNSHQRSLWGKGRSLLLLGRVEQAKRCFLRGLRVNPALPNAHMWLYVVYRVEGKHEEAALSLDRALQCESHDFSYVFNYYRDLCDLGWYEEAERVQAFIDELVDEKYEWISSENASGALE